MKRFWSSTIALSALAVGTALLAPACNHTDSSLFIDDVLAPPGGRSNSDTLCSYTPDPTAAEIEEGTLDVGLTTTYNAQLLAGNQMNPTADPESDIAETSRILVDTAQISVTHVVNGGPQQIGPTFRIQVASTINPGSGGTPGYGIVAANIISGTVADEIAAEVKKNGAESFVANVQLFGHTLGNQDVTSNVYPFPINVCYGCLVTLSADGTCDTTTTTSSSSTLPCAVGNDLPVDCSFCSGTNEVCRGGSAPVDAGDAGP